MIPKVSVIIPVHNCAPWLKECLDSIVSQSLRELEIICVDDASTDDSLSILNGYAQKDPRIRVVTSSEKLGAGLARNKGMDLAQGEFLSFCDADDAYTPNALEILYNIAKNSAAEIAGGNIAIMDEQLLCRRPLEGVVAAMNFYEDEEVQFSEYPPLWMPWFHPRFIFSTDWLKKNAICYPSLTRGQDPPFLAKAFCLARKIAVCPSLVYLYRTLAKGKRMSTPTWLGYLESVKSVFNIFMAAGHEKNACLYVLFSSQHWLSPRRLWSLRSDEYQRAAATVSELVKGMTRCGAEHMSFAPYPIQSKQILSECNRLLRDGRWRFLQFKVAQKILKSRTAIGWGRAQR